MPTDKATVLGIMSGSSLDGLDLCVATYEHEAPSWVFKIRHTQTNPLTNELKSRLSNSEFVEPSELNKLDLDYGVWVSDQIGSISEKFDFIAIHGHTVFHSPKEGVSLQIGNPQKIADLTQIPVIADFRNLDISLGGQGAPLVPMGEKLLFPDFDSFLNLGGICNLTIKSEDKWTAGDVGPFNQVFNYYSNQLGFEFDKGGELARSGAFSEDLYAQWRSMDFFKNPFPKSLSNQWVNDNFLAQTKTPSANVLHTFSRFISKVIAEQLEKGNVKNVLVSGGGAYNTHFIEQLRRSFNGEVILPSPAIIDFKEALIFGFLGLLKNENEINVMSQCTGASNDSSSGVIYKPSNI